MIWFLESTYESRLGESSKVSTLKAKIKDLRNDVDYLNSTDFMLLIHASDDLDTRETLGIPPDTIGDTHRDETFIDESNAKTDEEKIEVQEASKRREIYLTLGRLRETLEILQ